MDKSDLDAIATCGDKDLDHRPNVRYVSEKQILSYVRESEGLIHEVSSRCFAEWLHREWNDFNEEGHLTNREVIQGALEIWRGYISTN